MGKPKLRNLPDLSDRVAPNAEIAVRVTPKAAADRILVRDGTIRIYITAPPENGRANEATRELLAVALGVAPSALILKRGQTLREKVFVCQA